MERLELHCQQNPWTLEITVQQKRRIFGPHTAQRGLLRDRVESALTRTSQSAILTQSLTPDDRIVLVIDPELPVNAELIEPILDQIIQAGIEPNRITLLSTDDSNAWIDALDDRFLDILTEKHDPNQSKRLAYLAATKTGRRIYLNRTLVDADQQIFLLFAHPQEDPREHLARVIFPAYADAEMQQQFGGRSKKVTLEAKEVAWLLGLPFVLSVIPGSGAEINDVVICLANEMSMVKQKYEQVWQFSLAEPADLTILTVGSPEEIVRLEAITRSLKLAQQTTRPGCPIVLLSSSIGEIGPFLSAVRQAEEDEESLPEGSLVFHWLDVARTHRIYANIPDVEEDTLENALSVQIQSSQELQRLWDQATEPILLRDAQRFVLAAE